MIDQNKKINIISCGGLVVDFDNKKLLTIRVMYHHGKIEFPKGKLQPNETETEAARREIIEETGYTDFDLLSPIDNVQFSYRDKVGETDGTYVTKTVKYFLFRLNSHKQVENKQESHERIQNVWLDLTTAHDQIAFKSDKELFQKTVKILEKDYNFRF